MHSEDAMIRFKKLPATREVNSGLLKSEFGCRLSDGMGSYGRLWSVDTGKETPRLLVNDVSLGARRRMIHNG